MKQYLRSERSLQSLFSGALLTREYGPAGFALLEQAQQCVQHFFGATPEKLSAFDLKTCLERARKTVREPGFRSLTEGLIKELGFSGPGLMLDDLRLRAVSPGLQDNPQAEAVFYAHRDTWYGNPSCQINLWLPLQKVDPSNSFRFYLDDFESEIENDSARFQSGHFRGFGCLEPVHTQVYPRATKEPGGRVHDVSMRPGEVLLFSAAHLHQTLPNLSGKVRFSLDCRFFFEQHLQQKRGAPDRDNRSHGLVLGDYRLCE
ncbi:MAG: phytanoyl-CoA dioxygenase family protein [Vulcanimicrobiota bacterium]